MAVGIAQFLRIYDADDTDRVLWQNYWPGQFVDDHAYMPFVGGAIAANQTGIQEKISIQMPATPLAFDLVQAAAASGWLAEMSVYQFTITTATTTPPGSKTLTGRFTGEVIGGSMSLSTITIDVGSALTPIGIDVPVQKFSTGLVGAPPKL